MTKKYEKLVEELKKPWCQDCKRADPDDTVGWPDTCGPNEQFACDERVRQGITLIFSAVRDGELDEELGVVGRENVKKIVDAWLDEMVLMGATDFIALRKEEDLAAADWGLCGCCANITSRKEER